MSNDTKDRWRYSQENGECPENKHTHHRDARDAHIEHRVGLAPLIGSRVGPRCKGLEAVDGRTTHSRTRRIGGIQRFNAFDNQNQSKNNLLLALLWRYRGGHSRAAY